MTFQPCSNRPVCQDNAMLVAAESYSLCAYDEAFFKTGPLCSCEVAPAADNVVLLYPQAKKAA